MPLNAFLPIFLSFVLLIVIFLSLLHPANAFFPIICTCFPITTDFRFLHFLNTDAFIPVTLYDVLLMVTAVAIFKDVIFTSDTFVITALSLTILYSKFPTAKVPVSSPDCEPIVFGSDDADGVPEVSFGTEVFAAAVGAGVESEGVLVGGYS